MKIDLTKTNGSSPPSTTTRQSTNVQHWFETELKSLEDFAAESHVDRNAAITRLEKNLRHCRAKTRDAFVMWACKQVSKLPGFGGSMRAIRQLDLNVLNLIAEMRRAEHPAPFISMPDGNSVLIFMGMQEDKPRAWRVPTNQFVTVQGQEYSWAEAVEKLWPCFLEQVGGEFKVMTKLMGKNIHVARILLGARNDEQIRFANGNRLDYTGGNPYIVSEESARLQPRFDEKLMKYGTNSAAVDNATYDEMYAKPKAKAPTMDESGAIEELATGNFRTSNTKIVDMEAIPKDMRQTHDLWGYKPEERPVLASSDRQRDAQKHRVKGLFCLTCRTVSGVAVAHPNGVFTLQCGHTRTTKVAIMRYQTGYQVGYANECSDAGTY
jgi:hypothetical protein